MSRNPEHRKRQYTKPDHRPMIPEFRAPGDPLDLDIQEARRRFDDINPDHKMKWR